MLDLNGDGKRDVVISTGSSFAVALGVGDGSFAGVRNLSAASTSFAFADVDRDGRLDLVVVNGSLLLVDLLRPRRRQLRPGLAGLRQRLQPDGDRHRRLQRRRQDRRGRRRQRRRHGVSQHDSLRSSSCLAPKGSWLADNGGMRRAPAFPLLLLLSSLCLPACEEGTAGTPTGDAGLAADDGSAPSDLAGTADLLPADLLPPGPPCAPVPACDDPPPSPGPARDWVHGIVSPIIVSTGAPNHRGRDLFLNPGDPQWIIAKFAYGLIDKDLVDEDVDIYLQPDCSGPWVLLGTARTTDDNQHATVEGVEDSGGRIYFQIPPPLALGPGWHRVHLVVAGDLSTTDLQLAVVAPGTPMFISDVDGTLTTSETEEYTALLTGMIPGANPSSPAALSRSPSRGYHPMYVTARPEWLIDRTREFLTARGFPRGLVHTTITLSGAIGGSAVDYKTGELTMLARRGLVPAWAFGNTATDADAYANGAIQPIDHRVFFQFTDAAHGGRRIEDYGTLVPELMALPVAACP